jgi:hypothetical protein
MPAQTRNGRTERVQVPRTSCGFCEGTHSQEPTGAATPAGGAKGTC